MTGLHILKKFIMNSSKVEHCFFGYAIIIIMRKIRKLYYFDKKNMQEMISFLNNRDAFVNHIIFNPLMPLHHLLPLRFKFMPESYVLKDKKEIKGLITVAPSKCPLDKMEIQRLFFEENCYEDAGELIQYVVSKYKASGTASFCVRIDDYLPELLKLFVTRCGFSQISYERLWKVNNINSDFDKKCIRSFRNSDALAVSAIYNESLLPHFRSLLSIDAKEFKESYFKGLLYYSEYKYIIEDRKSKNIIAYISIRTNDNENYVLDLTQSSWVEIDIYSIISFAHQEIKKRQKNFNLFVKTKKYTHFGEKYDNEFMQHKFECIQTQIVLTNSSAKIIKDNSYSGKFTVLGQFYNLQPLCKDL